MRSLIKLFWCSTLQDEGNDLPYFPPTKENRPNLFIVPSGIRPAVQRTAIEVRSMYWEENIAIFQAIETVDFMLWKAKPVKETVRRGGQPDLWCLIFSKLFQLLLKRTAILLEHIRTIARILLEPLKTCSRISKYPQNHRNYWL